MAKVEVGSPAPDFAAMSSDGRTIRLKDYVGHRGLVIFFYPKNDTPICTAEACAFRDSYELFVDAGVEVIGVSSDSAESHAQFSRKHSLSFPLICDTDGSLRTLFSVPKTLGLFPGRVTYVIDRTGIVRRIFSAQFASDEHVKQALEAVRSESAD